MTFLHGLARDIDRFAHPRPHADARFGDRDGRHDASDVSRIPLGRHKWDLRFGTPRFNLATSHNPSFIGANGGTTASAEAALLASAAAGTSYFNIHTTVFPGGEIRGFLIPAAVPEPSSVIMLGISLLAVAAYGLRRRMVK